MHIASLMTSNAGWSWSPADVLRDADPNRANTSNNNAAQYANPRAPHAGGAENMLSSTAGTKPAATITKKRKSDALDDATREALFPQALLDSISDDDPRLEVITETCNSVRRKIRNWTESGAMKVGEFQDAIGVSSKGYSNFMNRTKAWDGEGCDTSWKAGAFFKKRELLGLPLKKVEPKAATAKKTKTSAVGAGEKAADNSPAAALLDVSGVDLPGEATGSVPVFDTCDEVRRKIRAFLSKDGVTQAALVRALNTCLPPGRNVSPTTMTRFLGQRGPRTGNTSAPYYAAYVFFEKRRIKDGKPKSKHRVEMEGVHGAEGMDLEPGANAGFTCFGNERPYVDKYGSISFH
ncbi:hypothetical protein GE09DRAFT_1290505 [Coniochaeta sp. 2T2.1]|nr:hypothetical protein GE09DRAFT_1290505 [Coniochaeta sp. 2T2.1]